MLTLCIFFPRFTLMKCVMQMKSSSLLLMFLASMDSCLLILENTNTLSMF